MSLMMPLKINPLSLKVHETLRSSSRLSIRLTPPTNVILSHVTEATVGVMNAQLISLIVATQLSAGPATMINALSAARRIELTS